MGITRTPPVTRCQSQVPKDVQNDQSDQQPDLPAPGQQSSSSQSSPLSKLPDRTPSPPTPTPTDPKSRHKLLPGIDSSINPTVPNVSTAPLIPPVSAPRLPVVTPELLTEGKMSPEGSKGKDSETKAALDPLEKRLAELDTKHDNIHKFNIDINHLEADGSNLDRWKDRTSTAVNMATRVSAYWNHPPPEDDIDFAVDRVAYRMIWTTVPEEIKDNISRITRAHEAMKHITSHFSQGGRSIQVATFLSLIKQSFDPSQTSLVKHSSAVTKDMNQLKSQGFIFDEDMIKGMFIQLGAPRNGPYAIMEEINNRLDTKYRDSPGPISSALVKTTMQNLIANCTATIESSKTHKAMAANFQSFQNSSQQTSQPCSGQRLTQARSGQIVRVISGPDSPLPFTKSDNPRNTSIKNPIPIPSGALKQVKDGMDQCFLCGEFGHTLQGCPHAGDTRTAQHWNDWRRVQGSLKMYSTKALWPMAREFHSPKPKPTGPSSQKVSAAAATWSAEGNVDTSNEVDAEYLCDGGTTASGKAT